MHVYGVSDYVKFHQVHNQLGTPGGAKSFPREVRTFWTVTSNFKRCPIHFSRGGKPPLSRPGCGPKFQKRPITFPLTIIWGDCIAMSSFIVLVSGLHIFSKLRTFSALLLKFWPSKHVQGVQTTKITRLAGNKTLDNSRLNFFGIIVQF